MRLDDYIEERAYRFFITEEIRALGKAVGGGISMNLHDFLGQLDGSKTVKEETKTGKEIIAYVKNGLHKLADRK